MLMKQARDMLENQLIPFWAALRDDEYGGFYGQMGYDLQIDRHAAKGCILNSRILWFFSRCAQELGRKDCLELARHAYRFLTEKCLDPSYGGVYWSVDHRGKALDDTKHTYNQAFAVYALSAYYEASGDAEALALAQSLFSLMEEKCRDQDGYLEAFDRAFCPSSNEKLSENGVLAERTMNTLLHVFEGYAGLYQASGNERAGKAMHLILEIYRGKIFHPALRRQEVFFDLHYNSLIDLHSYGHDIESSWLIDWGCGLLGSPALSAKIGAINQSLAHHILERAYQKHSILNECENGVDDPTRVWWVQAEAVLGFLNAWQKEPSCTAFRDAAVDIWGFIRKQLVDPRPGGEWFWSVDADGAPHTGKPIVSPWKCPYHNGRLCLEIIRRKWDVPC